jgi:hypothetical protein
LAEVVIVHAIKLVPTNVFLPFFREGFESCIWNTEVRTASIDDGWVFLLFNKIEFFTIVVHVSSLESPLFDTVHPIWPVSHSLNFLETADSTYNLSIIQTAEDSV